MPSSLETLDPTLKFAFYLFSFFFKHTRNDFCCVILISRLFEIKLGISVSNLSMKVLNIAYF